jgi:hypothetical protein
MRSGGHDLQHVEGEGQRAFKVIAEASAFDRRKATPDGTRTRDLCRDSEEEGQRLQKQASRMASFGAVRYDREPLSNPYQTHDLCPEDLCPTRILPQRMSCSISTRSSRPPSLRSPSREPLRSRGRAQSRAHLRQAGRALHQLRQRCPLAKITSVFIFMDFQQAPIGRPTEL